MEMYIIVIVLFISAILKVGDRYAHVSSNTNNANLFFWRVVQPFVFPVLLLISVLLKSIFDLDIIAYVVIIVLIFELFSFFVYKHKIHK